MQPRAQMPEQYEEAEPLLTFVMSEKQGDVHLFLPDTLDIGIVEEIANNFSRCVQEPVKVFHDDWRQKYRLCPFEPGTQNYNITFGTFCFECDSSEPPVPEHQDSHAEVQSGHIPRPRNKWILYRQHHAIEIRKRLGNVSASDLSTIISGLWKNASEEEKAFWTQKAEEDRLHKEKYPNYKFTTKKTPAKEN